MFLVAAALAADPGDAFVCPALTVPADGLRYADPGEISEALYDTLSGWVFAQYDEDCPTACAHEKRCTYADDCYTAAGTHVVVDYTWDQITDGSGYDHHTEAWSVQVETADGTSLSLSYGSEYRYAWDLGGASDVRAWTARWDGAVDLALPDTGAVTVEWDWFEDYDDNGHQAGGDAETLDSGDCAWDISRGGSGYTAWSEWETLRTIVVGAQTLSVGYGYAGLCEAARARDATLDGVAYTVDFDTWEPVIDADGDRVPADLDCDDANREINACEKDPACDGLDQDCDGADDADGDGDGHRPECADGDDCDDANYYIHPGGTDWEGDGVDGDCDGVDGVATEVEPPAPEESSGCGHGAWVLLPWVALGGRAFRR